MSQRYKGAVISATPPTTTGGNSGTAPGIWTMQQQLQAQGAGNWPPQPINYVEDVFSTYLYTGNGSTQTITNNIDLSTYGGLVWIKSRSNAVSHQLVDTARGNTKVIHSNQTIGNETSSAGYELTGFTSSGFSLGPDEFQNFNTNNYTFASWTFRKQPKFFDVVTWTGNGTNNRQISHALGSTPGCIIVKELNQTGSWYVYHRGNGTGKYMRLNATDPVTTSATYFPSVSGTTFTPTSDTTLNTSSVTYVAYLFAHDAGGFGLSGTDSVISCGSYTGDYAPNPITLGWEPQWVLIKNVSDSAQPYRPWALFDNMRGVTTGGNDNILTPNTSDAENGASAYNPAYPYLQFTSTGFQFETQPAQTNAVGSTYIYIAIRRGPMKTPTSGTSVFTPATATGSGSAATITGGPTPTDFVMYLARDAGHSPMFLDRLRGSPFLTPASTAAESAPSNIYWDVMNGYRTDSNYGNYATSDVREFFKRAPGFVDVVCYTGTGVDGLTINHNLNVVPEMIILKCRNNVGSFVVGTQFGASNFGFSILNLQNAGSTQTYGSYYGFYSKPTATSFALDGYGVVNTNSNTYVAYLFASCPGVSKVGSYTGTGGTQTISCGFAARFVLIKRTDSTGSWWVWDTARGMVAGTDPRLALQVGNSEVNADWVYTNASGFQIVTTDATVNASGGTYIYLAIA